VDQGALVEGQIDEGRELMERLSRNHFDVTAALWIKEDEDPYWLLYIASKVVDDKGLRAAYKDLHAVIRAEPSLRWIDLFELRLISAADPIVKDVLEILHRYPAGVPTRYRGPQLGGLYIDQAYIYEPVPVP
jgi:hypothetical protein